MCVHREANKSARVPWESSKTLLRSDSANEKLLVSQGTEDRQVVHKLVTRVIVWFFAGGSGNYLARNEQNKRRYLP